MVARYRGASLPPSAALATVETEPRGRCCATLWAEVPRYRIRTSNMR